MKSLVYRTVLVLASICIICGVFSVSRTLACDACGTSQQGDWYGNCFITNNTCPIKIIAGQVVPQECQNTYCRNSSGVRKTAQLCSILLNCAGGPGDPGLASKCT